MAQMHTEDATVMTELVYSQEPYMLNHKNSLYIVQNVFQYDRNRAVSVIYNWYHNLINTGYYSEPLGFDYNVNEIVYNTTIDIPNKTIVKYQNGYLALLPINIQVVHPI